MLKTPISIKGPLGQLEALFAERQVYQACKLLVHEPIEHWRYNEESLLTHARIKTAEGGFSVTMAWPPQTDPLGTCQCQQPQPCEHLAALAIHNKAKLDQISPFTRQVKALSDVNQTFMNWLARQHHDPFPAMARHRMIYVLDRQGQQWTVNLYKAYLTQEDRYEVRTALSSQVYSRKILPKFVSLADQYVLHLMHQSGMNDQSQFSVDDESHLKLMTAILQTGRCFWKACYRPPMHIINRATVPADGVFLCQGLTVLPAQNAVVTIEPDESHHASIDIPVDATIMPRVTLKTSVIDICWKPMQPIRIDWLQISFVTKDLSFTLAEVTAGKFHLNEKQLSQVAAYCYQLDKLPSVHAHFEPPIHRHFDVNDRYVEHSFTQLAPMLRVLMSQGWDVVFDQGFRLESQAVSQFQIDVQPVSGAAANDFEVTLGASINGETVNLLPYLARAVKTGQFAEVRHELLVKLDGGEFIGLARETVEQILSTLNELYDEKSLDQSGHLIMNKHQLVRLAELKTDDEQVVVMNLDWLDDQQLSDKVSALSAMQQLPEVAAPVGLNAELRPYQLSGLAWLEFLRLHEFNGILADDMGLGKTLQVLAHVQHLKEHGALDHPVLIVAPTSLLGNWQAECEKFTPQLKSLILSGQNRKQQLKKLDLFDLVITSYGVMSRDRKKLAAHPWHTLVLDEAQAIKNRKTQVAQSAKSIPSQHRLCLSGTPVENHLGEIWSLFEFLMPGFLASEKVFQQLYQLPIEKDRNQQKMEALQKRLNPFILRRTKSEVATELPDKTEIVKLIELQEEQAMVYESIRLTMADEIRQAVSDQRANPILIGNALLRLRQICCHPGLLKLESIDPGIESAKLNWLMMVLPSLIEEGRRILLFSSFTSMLKLISEQLNQQQIEHYSLTGKTPPAQRTADIAAFQEGQIPVYLISLKAGGAGVNLTAADTVIHFDPWWNPAAEQQASDRAHRIGQDKQVFVYKLITRGTIEERIHQMQHQKRHLADNLLQSSTPFYEVLDQQQWEQLLAPIKT